MRLTVSAPPAGGYGTITRTGRVGYSACAEAWPVTSGAAMAADDVFNSCRRVSPNFLRMRSPASSTRWSHSVFIVAHFLGPGVLAIDRDAPRERCLERGGERAGRAVLELDERSRRVTGGERQRPALGERADAPHRADQIAEAVEQMDAHAGHAAGAR